MNEDYLKETGALAFRFALLTLKNETDAKDIMQEVLFRLVRDKPVFDSDKAIKAWTYKVVINLCHNLRRHSWYRKRTEISEEAFLNIPDEHALDVEERMHLLNAVKALPIKYSEIIILYYYEGLNVADIAGIIGIAENSVYSRLSRAREMLKKKLKEEI